MLTAERWPCARRREGVLVRVVRCLFLLDMLLRMVRFLVIYISPPVVRCRMWLALPVAPQVGSLSKLDVASQLVEA